MLGRFMLGRETPLKYISENKSYIIIRLLKGPARVAGGVAEVSPSVAGGVVAEGPAGAAAGAERSCELKDR